MDVKKLSLMMGALVLAGASAMMARGMLSRGPASASNAAVTVSAGGPEVLVAIRTLPVGTILTPDMVRYQPWPKDLVESAYYVRGGGVSAAALNGTVVRYAVTAGQPVTQGALVKPGERGFLAAALGPGMRAITVTVTAQSGVAGFVFPGDRVDVVLSSSVTGGGDGAPLKVSETIVRNMRVLATDQTTDKTPADGKGSIVPTTTPQTVTLEATPKIAEKIAVAQTVGTLSLSLRSLASNEGELEQAIASGQVDAPKGDDPDAERRLAMLVATRPADQNTTFTTGGDVSRFQRSTVPGRPANSMSASPAPAGTTPPPGLPSGPIVRVARGAVVTPTPVRNF